MMAKKNFLLIALVLTAVLKQSLAVSLYEEKSFKSLVSDNRATKLGDIITIQIFENASASTNSDTTTRRKNDVSLGFSSSNGLNFNRNLSVGGDFDGGGSTQRAGRLVAQLTVSVTEVLSNGDLRVSGQQQVSINDEIQKIGVEGRIRPYDISENNVVLSTRLADAKITYLGDGEITERQRRGWWRKLLDLFGL
jgi:flagellar L-ring protein precursor FlgH